MSKSIEEVRTYFGITTPFANDKEEQRIKAEFEEAKELFDLNED